MAGSASIYHVRVSGSFVDGGSVVITAGGGEHFGSTGPSILAYDHFGDHSIGSPVDETATVGTWSQIREEASANIESVPSLYKGRGFQMCGEGDYSQVQAHWTPNQEVFACWKVYIPSSASPPAGSVGAWGGASSVKSGWLMYTADGDGDSTELDQYVFAWTGAVHVASGTNGTNTALNNWANSTFVFDAENRVSLWMKGNGDSAGEQRYELMNGSTHQTVNKTVVMFGATQDELIDRIKLIGWMTSAVSYSGGDRYFMQEIYVAQKPARVEQCNHATYSSATEANIWTPTSWADGSITCTVRNATSGWYIHIHDADGDHTEGGVSTRLIP